MKQRFIFSVFFFFSISISAVSGTAESVSIQQYMADKVATGQYVCEPTDPTAGSMNCYYMTAFSRTLDQKSDKSGVMKARTVNDRQGAFLEVKLDQLATSVLPENYPSAQIFEFYMKLHWKGERHGNLAISLEDSHLIKGRVLRSADKGFQIEIIALPDLSLFSEFMPSREVALMFDRHAVDEIFELEHDVNVWISYLITPVLESYFNQAEDIELSVP